ncbi:MAG: hypothetical protein DWQ53_14755 [Microcystis flos-aquae DF17]|nr:MAG: hypothetical protein DWQ53_14755 [Microcystis flos-aquae DF17]
MSIPPAPLDKGGVHEQKTSFSEKPVFCAEKVRAKHSDRKSPVSPIGYCPNASPLQDAGR